MEKGRRIKKRTAFFWYYVLAGILLFVLSTAGSYLYFKPKTTVEGPFIESIQSQRLREKPVVSDEGNTRRLYSPGEQRSSAEADTERSDSLAIAEDYIRKHMGTRGVKLLDLYMDRDGTLYADLGSEIRNSFSGDATEEYKMISDLYRGLKKAVPAFRSLKLLIEGQESESIGGHIRITKPIGNIIEHVDERETYRYF